MDEVANAILDSGLSPALQVTLMNLYRQAEGRLFVGTHADVAEARGVSRRAVSQQIEDLVRKGWLEEVGQALRVVTTAQDTSTSGDSDSNEGDGTSPDGSSTSTDGSSDEDGKGFSSFPFVFPQESITFNPLSPSPSNFPKVVSAAEAPLPSEIRWVVDEISWQAEPLPDDHRVYWDHLPGDWTYEFASSALVHLRRLDLLGTPVENKIERDGEDYVVSQWADTFRLLNEQDGYSQDEIGSTMTWLFHEENFWTSEEAIRSVPPLRSKVDDGDAYKFDVMHKQANANTAPAKSKELI